MKWFSISGIMKEIKRIRWSSPKQLAQDSSKVIVFTAFRESVLGWKTGSTEYAETTLRCLSARESSCRAADI